MERAHRRAVIGLAILLACCSCASALDPSLEISQYAHTAWTIREGFFRGNIYAIAQTPDGYLWLGTEFGLLRFDGNRSIPWQPPAGQHLPGSAITSLLGARDGTLWIGTDAGLVSWNGAWLTRHPELDTQLVATLLEDNKGTVWAGGLGSPSGRLCAMRNGGTQCYGQDSTLGRIVSSLYEDRTGTLWVGAQSGIWRWNPGLPTRYAMPPSQFNDLNSGDKGELLIATGGGMRKLVHGKSESYSIPGGGKPVNANRLLRDRDGGLWIGTLGQGLIHVHRGRTDVFSRSDGLSGDVVFSLFEDREGNLWVSTNGGLDRFRDLAVPTISVNQGLSTDAAWSVLAGRDGSVWIGTANGLNKWIRDQITIVGKGSRLPGDTTQSLFEDDRGRIWAFTSRGLVYVEGGKLVPVSSLHGGHVHSITGDEKGNLWLSEDWSLLHLREGRVVEQIPWSRMGRLDSASVLLSDHEQGGLWLGFWRGGGVSYFKDGKIHASYTAADGLTPNAVSDLQFDSAGALWVATQDGLNRIKDGRIATLTSRNGLPCNTVHWMMEDDDHSFWLYTACGLVRIARTELNAWIADPKRTIEKTVWDAADGVRLRSTAASSYGPRVAKSSDGKLWFVTGEGVQVIDPYDLHFNKIPPPVHIEQITADRKIYWQNGWSDAPSLHPRLPPLVRDLAIDYTALSYVVPEKVRFRYKLEGQDPEWKEVVNDREVQYSNLPPGKYRFRVIACNNSGVWNEVGDSLEFSIAAAWYQTTLFRASCVVVLLLLLWSLLQFRLRQQAHQFHMTLEARVSERTRIARDLHDTLLQSFHGLLLRFQTVVSLLPERPIEAKNGLESAIDQAAEAITEGRDAVQGLRASTVERNDLAQAITTIGGELCAEESNPNDARFEVHVEGTPRDLHPILRDEVYRIAAEAMRNAFLHAQAKQIEVEIRYDDRMFRLRVRDDGIGIDPKILSGDGRKGHYGLHGMRERAKVVGGRFDVWSEIDAGTEIELSIPAAIAYATSPRSAWWSRRFSKKGSDVKETIDL